MTDAATQRGNSPPETSLPAGPLAELASAFASARVGLSEFLNLVSLEARRAGLALMWMVVLALVAAVCLVASWLALMGALAMWVVALGLSPIAAAIVVAAVNLLTGCALIYVGTRVSHNLLFSATRRQVMGKSPVAPPSP